MIQPYTVRPAPPRMGLLLGDGTVVDEDGQLASESDRGLRVYTSPAWAMDALRAVRGSEHLTWNAQAIRWRREPGGERHWTPRASDVVVIDAEFPEEPDEIMAGLTLWRDWLAFHGAPAGGTVGSAAMRLLRATIDRPLWLGVGAPRVVPLGGRQVAGAAPGTHVGPFVHWDIPAAYASTLAAVAYGGWWRPREPSPKALEAEWRWGTLVLAHAEVDVPKDLPFGPLPRRRRSKVTLWESQVLEYASDARPTYPRGKIRGLWSWAELHQAAELGCRVRPDAAWAHVVPHGHRPFLQWWLAIEEGRAEGGFAGVLAKMTGNALVGMWFERNGVKGVRTYEPDRDGFAFRAVPVSRYQGARAPELAECVTGAVRAELGRVLNGAPTRVLSAHTDGGWFLDSGDGWRPDRDQARPGPGSPPGVPSPSYAWRAKDRARRIDYLGPQVMALHPEDGGRPRYVVAGSPDPEGTFAERWIGAFRTPYDPASPDPAHRTGRGEWTEVETAWA